MNDDDFLDFKQELKEAAWNVLHDNPGSDYSDWEQTLLEQYPTEVVDALGTSPEDVFAQLADWWENWTYEDENTGICETFQDWSLIFANEQTVMLYEQLAELSAKLSRTEPPKFQRLYITPETEENQAGAK